MCSTVITLRSAAIGRLRTQQRAFKVQKPLKVKAHNVNILGLERPTNSNVNIYIKYGKEVINVVWLFFL